MLDIILDTIIDSVKLIPFLFVTFIFLEFIEHKMSDSGKEKIEKSGKLGPLFGSILGAIPQCGFSIAATNLYVTRVITLGTLMAIYLSTSDEMLPILLSQKVDIKLIVSIICFKVVLGIIYGFLIDLFLRKKQHEEIKEFCEDEDCDCEKGILISALKHTLHIIIFITIVEFLLNSVITFIGIENVENLFMKNSVFGSFITSIIGLIPNCASSVAITELYLKEIITFGSMIAGLLTGSGVAILVLFKLNKNMKENFKIVGILYSLGVLTGIIIDIVSKML